MTAYILRRLALSILVLWGAVTVVFVAIRLAPGDPAQMMLGPSATAQEVAALRTRLGLDQPAPVQYARYLVQVARLDLGESLRLNQPALAAILERVPQTARLSGLAMLVAILLSFPMGIASAIRPGTVIDRLISILSLLGQSVPSFWLGIMLILVFARGLQLLPSGGADTWQHLVLPTITLALPLVGILTRLIRSGLLDVLLDDYIRTARAKGLTSRKVMVRHALLNMLIPVITVIGLQLGTLLGGAVIVESVFAWPGVGRLLVDGIGNRDYPLVQAAILVITTAFVVINLLVDVSYGYLDPRIRLR
ncbi:MAG: ABC transporter permease [Chloroflexi bacterium]|nr:ABC transporter permease [Chloroflexota bacterium]